MAGGRIVVGGVIAASICGCVTGCGRCSGATRTRVTELARNEKGPGVTYNIETEQRDGPKVIKKYCEPFASELRLGP